MSDTVEVRARFVLYLQLKYPIDIGVVGEIYKVLLILLIHILSSFNLVKVRTG
jgi:hypothetical protein